MLFQKTCTVNSIAYFLTKHFLFFFVILEYNVLILHCDVLTGFNIIWGMRMDTLNVISGEEDWYSI